MRAEPSSSLQPLARADFRAAEPSGRDSSATERDERTRRTDDGRKELKAARDEDRRKTERREREEAQKVEQARIESQQSEVTGSGARPDPGPAYRVSLSAPGSTPPKVRSAEEAISSPTRRQLDLFA